MARVLVVLHDHHYHDPELGALAEPEPDPETGETPEPVFKFAVQPRDAMQSETLDGAEANALAQAIEDQRARVPAGEMDHSEPVWLWGETRVQANMIASVVVVDGDEIATSQEG